MDEKERKAFHEWDKCRPKTPHANIQAWEAACSYKSEQIRRLREALERIKEISESYSSMDNENYYHNRIVEIAAEALSEEPKEKTSETI